MRSAMPKSMKNFLVSYTLGYEHRVSVGVEARSAGAAREKVQAALDNGTLWDDPGIRLLQDEYEENDGNVLELQSVAVEKFPPPEASAVAFQEQGEALALARLIASLPLWGELEEGEPFEPSDGLQDSHDALMGLIRKARRIFEPSEQETNKRRVAAPL